MIKVGIFRAGNWVTISQRLWGSSTNHI